MTDLTVTLIADPAAPPGTPPDLIDADAAQPHLLVTDLGVNRGDGIFEGVGAVGRRLHSLNAHLRRFARSAALLELPPPNLDAFGAAARRCAERLAERHPDRQLTVKFLYTRGQEVGEDPPRPVGWAMAFPTADFTAERAGMDVVTLSRGVRSDVAATAPWLLAGAKTLSYAANRAATREAHRRGAHDVLFTSTDGYALEGPTSSLIAVIGGRWVTPSPDQGVLPGTTQADLFGWAMARGIPTETRPVPLAELDDADALWLVSSVRLGAPLRSLDGRGYPVDAALTAELNAFLLARD